MQHQSEAASPYDDDRNSLPADTAAAVPPASAIPLDRESLPADMAAAVPPAPSAPDAASAPSAASDWSACSSSSAALAQQTLMAVGRIACHIVYERATTASEDVQRIASDFKAAQQDAESTPTTTGPVHEH
mmetsp:Transcript_36897/g.73613  ORF Transcript_36897/g.73613 Transcript_36897/m.73613 type:complete len:131 (+) Transcript_36897:772-1164(+)